MDALWLLLSVPSLMVAWLARQKQETATFPVAVTAAIGQVGLALVALKMDSHGYSMIKPSFVLLPIELLIGVIQVCTFGVAVAVVCGAPSADVSSPRRTATNWAIGVSSALVFALAVVWAQAVVFG